MSLSPRSRPSTRPYRSPLRDEQAALTQARVINSAAHLFAENGYAATSLVQIAEHAGVSVETVKLIGPKRTLILDAFEAAFGGSDGGEFVVEKREALLDGEAHDGIEFLNVLVEFIAHSNQRMAPLWPALQTAAEVDKVVKVAFTHMQESRLHEFQLTIQAFAAGNIIDPKHNQKELAEALSFLVSPESYLQLVRGAGWEFEKYILWLHRAVRALIVTDPAWAPAQPEPA